ncbi:hypothetical protein GQR58_008310 [Nymphon striatum]|nr:hypothetical protein GQR58_008310 [Nymphon striatum]
MPALLYILSCLHQWPSWLPAVVSCPSTGPISTPSRKDNGFTENLPFMLAHRRPCLPTWMRKPCDVKDNFIVCFRKKKKKSLLPVHLLKIKGCCNEFVSVKSGCIPSLNASSPGAVRRLGLEKFRERLAAPHVWQAVLGIFLKLRPC